VFAGAWSDFKIILAEQQNGFCGFCEGPTNGHQFGDVEHFRPKAEVHELVDDPDQWGWEPMWHSSAKDREVKKPAIRPGYWWLAYEWENYVYSCQTCNQQWKGNLFPVQGTRARAPGDTGETALLLSPFDLFDPADHFEYGRLGEIRGKSPQGHATIVTCGLDRPSLRVARYRLASATHLQLDQVADQPSKQSTLNTLDLIRQRGDPREAYSGMVQTIFRQRTRLHWDDLARLIRKLREM